MASATRRTSPMAVSGVIMGRTVYPRADIMCGGVGYSVAALAEPSHRVRMLGAAGPGRFGPLAAGIERLLSLLLIRRIVRLALFGRLP